MSNNFVHQTAIVTGAASGIGKAIAGKLLEEGATVYALDLAAIDTREVFGEQNRNVIAVAVDVTNEKMVLDTITNIITTNEQVHILINCVGITGETNIKSHEVDTTNLLQVFNVNFMSAFYTSKAVLPHMVTKKYGRILHLASIAGKEGNAGMLAYSASKAAMIAMAKVQGKEYAETGVTINALAPAVVRTPLVDKMPEQQVKYMTDKIPMKRCGTLEEAANLAAYIVSPANSFTTGFTFDLSGGRATY
jgi:3-oxoacyl-[acyl-carrier protein] reductase